MSSALDNTSFTDLLMPMGNDVDCVSTFDFIDNSSDAGGLQWSSHGSAPAIGQLSQYSSEGDNTYSESLMYGNDLDLADLGSLDVFLPIPQIPNSVSLSCLTGCYASINRIGSTQLEAPAARAAVAADLNTANILLNTVGSM